jgi:hypothetical protein
MDYFQKKNIPLFLRKLTHLRTFFIPKNKSRAQEMAKTRFSDPKAQKPDFSAFLGTIVIQYLHLTGPSS